MYDVDEFIVKVIRRLTRKTSNNPRNYRIGYFANDNKEDGDYQGLQLHIRTDKFCESLHLQDQFIKGHG